MKVFGAGRPPGYPSGRPRHMPHKNSLCLGCFSVPENGAHCLRQGSSNTLSRSTERTRQAMSPNIPNQGQASGLPRSSSAHTSLSSCRLRLHRLPFLHRPFQALDTIILCYHCHRYHHQVNLPKIKFLWLMAQREIPAHIAQYFFEIVSQRGYRTHFAFFACGIAQVSLRYPFCWGGGRIAPPLRTLSNGERLRKGGEGIAPNWSC